MSNGLRIWTHGVSVVPEWTREYTGDENGLYMRPMGNGTRIRQNRDTDNWFHFAIPSASKLDTSNVSYLKAWVRFNTDPGAVITAIHVWENQEGGESERVDGGRADQLEITGSHTQQYEINLTDARCKGPLVICVHVHFRTADAEILFTGAGAHFEKIV